MQNNKTYNWHNFLKFNVLFHLHCIQVRVLSVWRWHSAHFLKIHKEVQQFWEFFFTGSGSERTSRMTKSRGFESNYIIFVAPFPPFFSLLWDARLVCNVLFLTFLSVQYVCIYTYIHFYSLRAFKFIQFQAHNAEHF